MTDHLRTMDLHWLRTFARVLETASISRAATELGLSQPAVTRRVQKLEALVKQPLLHRSSRILRPTPAGQLLGLYARQILKLHDAALAEIDSSRIRRDNTAYQK